MARLFDCEASASGSLSGLGLVLTLSRSEQWSSSFSERSFAGARQCLVGTDRFDEALSNLLANCPLSHSQRRSPHQLCPVFLNAQRSCRLGTLQPQ